MCSGPVLNMQMSGGVFPEGNAGGVLRYQLLRCVPGVHTSAHTGKPVHVPPLQVGGLQTSSLQGCASGAGS